MVAEFKRALESDLAEAERIITPEICLKWPAEDPSQSFLEVKIPYNLDFTYLPTTCLNGTITIHFSENHTKDKKGYCSCGEEVAVNIAAVQLYNPHRRGYIGAVRLKRSHLNLTPTDEHQP